MSGRRRGLLLALLLAPFWINYLMRMLAWVNLLQTDGYVNDVTAAFGFDRVNWLDGRAVTVVLGLAYGYVPFLVLPLFAALDRIDPRLLEASRDLGMGPATTFLRVTLPLSRQGMLAAAVITALPMTGDFYTADLLSGSPRTSMIGNQIEFYLFEGSQKSAGAALVIILSVALMVAMVYYLRSIDRSARELRAHEAARRPWWEDPWRRPVFLATVTWLYIVWSIVPVLIAIQFSFNSGRSRSTWQGFSFRWWWGDPDRSLWHDESLRDAMVNSLTLAGLTMLDRDPARRRAGDRPLPVAWTGRPGLEPAHARAALHAGDRDGGDAVPRLRQPLHGDPARSPGDDPRPRHVLDLLRRRDRARPAAHHRAEISRRPPRTSARRRCRRCAPSSCRCSARPSSPA